MNIALKVALSVIWFVFALMFATLATHHRKLSQRNIPHFREMPSYGRPAEVAFQGGLTPKDIDDMVKDFSDRFNDYIDQQNQSSRNLNHWLSIGSWVASTTALVSLIMIWIPL